jgi:hypothetical protein
MEAHINYETTWRLLTYQYSVFFFLHFFVTYCKLQKLGAERGRGGGRKRGGASKLAENLTRDIIPTTPISQDR